MSQIFDAVKGLILVEAQISGPTGTLGASLVLDTGATRTSLNASLLRSIGYEPDVSTDSALVTTGLGMVTVPCVTVNRPGALGKQVVGLRVLSHTLPLEAAVDGLLGLDFLRGSTLTFDFRAGVLALG
jgi:predicted aspartyl protease